VLKKIHNQLNFGQTKKKFSIVQKILVLLIVSSSIIVVIETEKDIFNQYNVFFEYSKYFFGIIFTIEYILRVVTAGYLKKYKGFSGRISYIFSFWTLIDLIAILPFFISGVNETFLLRLFRLIRLFSVIRIGRYSSALKNVLDAISDRKHELLFAVAISSTVLVISSTFMYLLEAELQPEAFGSIIRSVWWAAAALTTVGYGDVYPITALGKVFAVVSAFSSIGIVALPAGILAGSFTEKFKRSKK
jgi:voltage-gated potassium channel